MKLKYATAKVNVIVLLALGLSLSACKSMKTEAPPADGSMPRSQVAKINVNLGLAYLENKNVQRAKQKFLLALKQDPDIPEPWYSMAYFHEATGNLDEANRFYAKAVEIAPQRGDAQNNYGTFLCRQGNYQQAISHFMLAVKSPDYLDPAAAYENAGLCSMKSKSYAKAAEFFNQALLKDPARTLSLLNLALADLKQGKYQQAKAIMVQYSLVAQPNAESNYINNELAKHTG